MPIKWDAENQAKLFRRIIKNAKLGKKDHEELGDYMGKQYIGKIQRAGPEDDPKTPAPSSPAASDKQTPKKRTPAASGSGTGSGKKRKNQASDGSNGDPFVDGSPTIKRVKEEGRNVVKVEDYF
ncbi:hypothetical protein FQN53_002171 [Emmonsiellopsis sp. PD_33]|nr:hypothetical protein FQN53_002171 [Emmonsiellopsis sp. PD_33]KAK2800739.1 hypothetical protein FQN51_005879 [Onygenales sp. PD_10]